MTLLERDEITKQNKLKECGICMFRSVNTGHVMRLLSHKYNQSDGVNVDEIGRACSTHRREQACTQDFDEETREKETIRNVCSWTG
jgi:hypothetical protein